jgi:hypothetical protein
MKRFKIIGPIILLAFLFLSFYDVIAQEGDTNVFLPLFLNSGGEPTPEPTDEPTPEPTEGPPPGPPPEPTPDPTSVNILPNHTYYSEENRFHIVGEVENTSTYNLRYVVITANIFNSSGQLLDTTYTLTYLDILEADEKTCFHLIVDYPEGWDYYEFELSYWADGDTLPDLSVTNLSPEYNSDNGWYDITGDVTNNEGVSVENVGLTGTLYDASNDVVGCSFANTEPSDLDPSQTRSFYLTFLGRDYHDVTDYRIQADADIQ